MPSAPTTTIDLFTQLTTSAGGFTAVDGYTTGIVLDPTTNLFYVTGAFRNAGASQEREFLIAVSKTGIVTPLLQEINGDTVIGSGSGYGLAFADFADPVVAAVPEPASLALWSILGVLGLAFGYRRTRQD